MLLKCVPIKYQFRDKPDAQAVESYLEGVKLPQWATERMRTKFLECREFIHGNAFAGMPDRPGGYESMRFWSDSFSLTVEWVRIHSMDLQT
jgi:hypothetical protein